MRRLLAATTTAIALAGFGFPATAMAASHTNITVPEGPMPANGGDNGLGNCGHNSSGGNPHTGDNGNGGGNGGDHGDSCLPPTNGGGDGGGGGPVAS
jgi:hypothetical protein